MTDKGAHQQENGTLLQGGDGAVYFIPAERMAEFRVADEDSVGVREALGQLDPEVAGFAAPMPLKDGVAPLRAFSGPLGFKPPVLQGTEGDGIWGG